MATALGTLRDHGIRAAFDQMLGQHRSRHHRNHRDAGLFPALHVLAGVARAGGDKADAFLHHDLGKRIRLGMHQHDVDAERLVGELFGAADILPQRIGIHTARTDQTQRAGVGAGGGKFAGGNVGHAALNQRIPGTENLVQQFHTTLPFTVSNIPPQVRPPPKPIQARRMPGCRRPFSYNSFSATGMLAALVLPWRSIFL